MKEINFTDEQLNVINTALDCKNVLVDACIGSGKTTTIQELVDRMQGKQILYLTYNSSLKVDARNKIKNCNVDIDSFNSFAYRYTGIKNTSMQLKGFVDELPEIDNYDVLLLDEYQDIGDLESKILLYIKDSNPGLQVIAVGDMEQKIRCNSKIDVVSFLDEFMGDYVKLSLSTCFRIETNYVSKLADTWNKQIIGVSTGGVMTSMGVEAVIQFLADKDVGDILVLGSNSSRGLRVYIQNQLEKRYPDKFNKNTLYSTITDDQNKIITKSDIAYFITYDKCKGMERKYCVVCDFTYGYWDSRISKMGVEFEAIRNLFLVAASRGSCKNIYVKRPIDKFLNKKYIYESKAKSDISYFNVSEMFRFKYAEDILACYNLLEIEEIPQEDTSEICAISSDGLVDLSTIVGSYQEALFFGRYNLDKALREAIIDSDIKTYNAKGDRFINSKLKRLGINKKTSLTDKLKVLTSLETGQTRYRTQVHITDVLDSQNSEKLINRLSTYLDRDNKVQVTHGCNIKVSDDVNFRINGRVDCIKQGVVYELKFVSELSIEHFLQCAWQCILLSNKKMCSIPKYS